MGKMMNLFDLSAGMLRAKFLSVQGQRDGGSPRRDWLNSEKKSLELSEFPVDEKTKTTEPRNISSCKQSGGTPMKMLLAQEMLKETEPKQKPPSIIAKLMGLDTMPALKPGLTANTSWHECYPSGAGSDWTSQDRQNNGEYYFSCPLPSGTSSFTHEEEFRDVHEVHEQPSMGNQVKEVLPQKGRPGDRSCEKRMAMVRQKFIEAKRLVMDEKLMRSKEFQDAIEILSANRDIFLKILEEPNSLFSKQLDELHTVPPPPQTRRITVLQPSKSMNPKGDKETNLSLHSGAEFRQNAGTERFSSSCIAPKNENLSHPTRIVVLKPGVAKPHRGDISIPDLPSLPKLMDVGHFSEGYETDEENQSRTMVKEITKNMQERLIYPKDDSLLSSILSNEYVGDVRSFDKSDEYFAAEGGNFSVSEIASPVSLHSCNHLSTYDSPYSSPCSFSSFGQVVQPSNLRESTSVVKEAKRRLSERLALVKCHVVEQEMQNTRRSSSTLGEMLSIPAIFKKEEYKKDEVSASSAREIINEDFKSGHLTRSKSVPVSSSIYKSIETNVEVPPCSQVSEPLPSEGILKKSNISKFRWRISNLFLSRSKKSKKPIVPDDLHDCICNEVSSSISGENSGSSEFLTCTAISSKASLPIEKTCSSESSSDNREQPSPVSVLEGPFEDDDANRSLHGSSQNLLSGNLQALSRSPPIGSLPRSLSWDHDTNPKSSTAKNSWKHSVSSANAVEEEEQERILFIHGLLTSSGMDEETSLGAFFLRWHSPESPLDPNLLQEFIECEKEGMNYRERISQQRFLFDCVNAALLEIGHTANAAISALGASKEGSITVGLPVTTEQVWRMLKAGFSNCERAVLSGEAMDRVVRKEVSGIDWSGSIRRESEEINKEIAKTLLEEVVAESLEDLSHWMVFVTEFSI